VKTSTHQIKDSMIVISLLMVLAKAIRSQILMWKAFGDGSAMAAVIVGISCSKLALMLLL
jgi:hypothetical protein